MPPDIAPQVEYDRGVALHVPGLRKGRLELEPFAEAGERQEERVPCDLLAVPRRLHERIRVVEVLRRHDDRGASAHGRPAGRRGTRISTRGEDDGDQAGGAGMRLHRRVLRLSSLSSGVPSDTAPAFKLRQMRRRGRCLAADG